MRRSGVRQAAHLRSMMVMRLTAWKLATRKRGVFPAWPPHAMTTMFVLWIDVTQPRALASLPLRERTAKVATMVTRARRVMFATTANVRRRVYLRTAVRVTTEVRVPAETSARVVCVQERLKVAMMAWCAMVWSVVAQ